MPGIFGFTQKRDMQQADKADESGKLNIHADSSYHIRQDYANSAMVNSIVSFNFMQGCEFHYEINGLEIWVYGDPIIEGYTGAKSIQETAMITARSFPDFSKIAAIDGLFTIIVLDKPGNKLFILGDRNGLSHVYYGIFEGQLVWGSELRAFLTKNIDTTIRNSSLTTFLELGYLTGNNTWFNEIKLLPPASCLEWDLETAELKSITPYWSHHQLEAENINRDENKTISDLAELFAQAVSKRVAKEERIGITLSGGQDSRAIFANIPYRENGLVAITRGISNCGDIQLASQVAKTRKDCTHIIKEMNENNWLNGRINAVIATSGQKDIFNMNAMGSLPIHKNYFDINMDGAGGDGIFGGGHLKYENKANAKKALKGKYLKSVFNNDNTLEDLYEYYTHVGSDQYFYMYQRVRRFTIFGSILGHDYGIISRFPFLDHQLQEYLFQLPKKTNFGRLYNKMLIRYFPEYFVKIDNLNTGSRLFVSDTLNYLSRVFRYAQSKAGFQKYNTKYHNYPYWIRHHDKGLRDQYLFPQKLKLYEYVDPQPIKKAIDDFSRTGEQSGLMSRLITLNIFLEHRSL